MIFTFVEKMKVTELLKIASPILSAMERNDIMRNDYRYLQTYEEFLNMRSHNVKYKSAIKMLAEEHHISERTLERIFKRLSKECV